MRINQIQNDFAGEIQQAPVKVLVYPFGAGQITLGYVFVPFNFKPRKGELSEGEGISDNPRCLRQRLRAVSMAWHG